MSDNAGGSAYRDMMNRMHGFMSPTTNFEFLKNCFFVFECRSPEESEDPEDVILYFYPQNVPSEQKINVWSVIASLADLASNFISNKMETLCMERWKAAFRHYGNYTFVLTGSMENLDTTLMKQVEDLSNAFHFFNGPFLDVIGMHSSLQNLRMDLRDRCFIPLKPMLAQYAVDVFNSLRPIPYTELPNYSNRLFLSASQILHLARRDRHCFGGCVLFDRSILCTHLDFTITRWIMARQDISREESLLDIRPLSNVAGRTSSTVEESHHIVFLSKQEYERLQSECIIDLSQSEPELSESVEIPAMYKEPRSDGHWVGLCIFHTKRIALALLLNIRAIMNERYTKKLRVNFESKLIDLEKKVSRAMEESPPVRENIQGISVPQTRNYQASAQSSEYNYIIFDEDGRQARGNSLDLKTSVDANFVYVTGVAHDIFQDDPSVSQIVLRDFSGTTYVRKVFSREVFFHDKSPASRSFSREDPMGEVEKKARERLSLDHGIQLI